jgi:D-methionine transport system substrate-binding protein
MKSSFRTLAAFMAAAVALAISPGTSRADDFIKVGVTAGPHAEIFDEVLKIAAQQGLKLKVIEFTDYAVPNQALEQGDLDLNSFQNEPFLAQQIKDRGYHLVSIGKTVLFPMGLYSKKHKTLTEIPDGATVAIPNDPSNAARALQLLAKAKLIALRPGAAFLASPSDITANPKKLVIKELNAAQTARSLGDVDFAAINGDYAETAGLNPRRDALFSETGSAADALSSPYTNIIAARANEKDDPRYRAIVAIYHSAAIKAFIEAHFKGAVVPGF